MPWWAILFVTLTLGGFVTVLVTYVITDNWVLKRRLRNLGILFLVLSVIGFSPLLFNRSQTSVSQDQSSSPAADDFIQMQVRVHGTSRYATAIAARPGDVIDYKVELTNHSAETLKRVMVKVTIPTGLRYEEGTAVATGLGCKITWPIPNYDYDPTYDAMSGTCPAFGSASLTFSVEIPSSIALPCQDTLLQSTSNVDIDYTRSDHSSETVITIYNQCQPSP